MTEQATYSGTDAPPDGTYRTTSAGLVPIVWGSGYSVGVSNIVTTRGPLSAEGILTLAPIGIITVGVWTDPATGDTHYDRVRNVARYAGAMKLARRNGEIAIWDNGLGAAVAVQYREGR